MFTGIVEEKGIVKSFTDKKLTVECKKILYDIKIGDSIAVNGCCLTVISLGDLFVSFDIVKETLACTTFKNIKPLDEVNLERPLKANARFDGHIVQGHIDTLGQVTHIDDTYIYITIPEKHIKYIVKKGSVAVDGVSLTVADIQDKSFSIALIPHTKKETTLGNKKIGDLVNIETDILAKYIERLYKND